MSQDNRNLALAFILSALILIGWGLVSERFFPTPPPPAATAPAAGGPAPAGTPATAVAGGVPGVAGPATLADRTRVLASSPRLIVETPKVRGSINLKGARFDDLVLEDYRETVAKTSPAVRMLSPSGTADAYFGQFGWTGPGAPPADALWTASAPKLTPAAPVTLSWTSPQGATFEQVIAIDKDYMFTVRQRVTNRAAVPLALRPWGLVSRRGEGPNPTTYTLHTGPVGVIDGTLHDTELEYEKLRSDGARQFTTTGGWFGLTDIYWLAALIPDQKTRVEARYAYAGAEQFQADFLAPAIRVAPGATAETTQHFFAGAKEVNTLDRYMAELNIPHFDLAVSWGWFIILAKPIFHLLDWLFKLTGNFGIAIIGLTLIVRLALFPIANKQYEAMAKMRLVGPRMKAIQERWKDDKVRQNQEMMALYKTEKVNPVSGCLPIFLQIPIFFSLYKTLLVAIEMRHQPFVLWLKDLSAPDPLTPVNLFGLIPWSPPAAIAIGVLPILLGVTMYVQQKLNPPPADPVQAQVFAVMPWVFMFIMAPFAAGLQLYWTINNLASIAQQAYMLRKFPTPATPPAAETIDVTPTPAPAPTRPTTPPPRRVTRGATGKSRR
ncbi:preprotein translocase YidC [alpha proteobacterium AAP81b]|nr:preprotein translocase YidC [alpha proteobacterium AAP81b]